MEEFVFEYNKIMNPTQKIKIKVMGLISAKGNYYLKCTIYTLQVLICFRK